MIRPPPTSPLFPYPAALPISTPPAKPPLRRNRRSSSPKTPAPRHPHSPVHRRSRHVPHHPARRICQRPPHGPQRIRTPPPHRHKFPPRLRPRKSKNRNIVATIALPNNRL